MAQYLVWIDGVRNRQRVAQHQSEQGLYRQQATQPSAAQPGGMFRSVLRTASGMSEKPNKYLPKRCLCPARYRSP